METLIRFFCVYRWLHVHAADTLFPVSDWRQIQARIRKARTSADPSGQLAALYERTRDAMVAFELAQIHEKAGTHSEAARWYTAAAERFRRAQWKLKAEEALTRLGAPIPASLSIPISGSPTHAVVSEMTGETTSEMTGEPAERLEPIIAEFSDEQVNEAGDEMDGGQQESVFEQPPAGAAAPAIATATLPPGHRRKRRGRRGGRGRNKGLRAGVPGVPTPVAAPVPPSAFDRPAEPRAFQPGRAQGTEEFTPHVVQEAEPARGFETVASSSTLQMRARSGDPALSSRMVKLESQLRRMLACAVYSVDQSDEAPAGPGVFLITDTDQTTYYYVEACQTLRVGIGNLLRSGRNSREGAGLKEKLAEHLGINEARVGKYLKDHCVVRWLQLDEGAPLLAHFSVAVLRPIANE